MEKERLNQKKSPIRINWEVGIGEILAIIIGVISMLLTFVMLMI